MSHSLPATVSDLRRRWWLVLGIAAAYAGAAKLSFLVTIPPGNISPIFPSAGIALACVILCGRPAVAGVWLGSFIANGASFFNWSTATPKSLLLAAGVAACIGTGAAAGAWLGAGAVARLRGQGPPLGNARNVLVLAGAGALLGCLVSPTVGVASLVAGGYAQVAQAGYSWLTWWVGDAVGAIVMAPLVLAFAAPADPDAVPARGRKAEAVSLAAATLLFCAATFFWDVPVAYGSLVVMGWAAFRFGVRGATLVAAAIAAGATVGTGLGRGVFAAGSVNASLLLLHSFLGTTVVCALVLAGVLDDQRRTAHALRRHREHLEEEVASRTEALAKARDAAEAANQAKGAFLAAMSHEIRTPMNAVINMVGTVLEGPLEAEPRHYLKVADASARHLLSIIGDILDFSKIESGKLEVEDVPFSLHGLLDGGGDLFQAQHAGGKVAFVLERAPDLPDGVRGDPMRLRQILVNLVGNAFKFTREGKVTLRAGAADGKLRIDIADTGIGIAKAHQDRLFEPFVQADAATTRRFGGTGLGLAISRRLARLMGGDIGVASAEGRGSVFTVILPLHPEPAGDRGSPRQAHAHAAAPTPAGEGAPAPFTGVLALLAEDNKQNQLVAKVLLKKLGIAVEVADNGRIALEMAQADPGKYQVILMDMQMPEMDGLEATRRIRAAGEQVPALKAIPIVAMTANAMKSDQEACQAAGMDGFVAKPIDRAALAAELGRVLGRGRMTVP